MSALYNCHEEGLDYRITKFIDGNPEASYLTTRDTCDCPAGHRSTCRHRQMLPEFLNRHLVDSALFWNFDGGFSCDISGNASRITTIEPAITVPTGQHVEEDTTPFGLERSGLTTIPSPHSVAASTEAFDASSTGSNPVGATRPATWRRL